MSPRFWEDRLRDTLEAVEEIFEFTSGMDASALAADAKTLKAVLANFAIIGEAATHLPEEVTNRYPDVPWRAMRTMRNFVIHAYFSVEPAIVWETIRSDLPDLAARLRAILDAEGCARRGPCSSQAVPRSCLAGGGSGSTRATTAAT